MSRVIPAQYHLQESYGTFHKISRNVYSQHCILSLEIPVEKHRCIKGLGCIIGNVIHPTILQITKKNMTSLQLSISECVTDLMLCRPFQMTYQHNGRRNVLANMQLKVDSLHLFLTTDVNNGSLHSCYSTKTIKLYLRYPNLYLLLKEAEWEVSHTSQPVFFYLWFVDSFAMLKIYYQANNMF